MARPRLDKNVWFRAGGYLGGRDGLQVVYARRMYFGGACRSSALQWGVSSPDCLEGSERIWMEVCCCCEVIAHGVSKQGMMAVVSPRVSARTTQLKQDHCSWRQGSQKREQGKENQPMAVEFPWPHSARIERLEVRRLTCRRRWCEENADDRVIPV